MYIYAKLSPGRNIFWDPSQPVSEGCDQEIILDQVGKFSETSTFKKAKNAGRFVIAEEKDYKESKAKVKADLEAEKAKIQDKNDSKSSAVMLDGLKIAAAAAKKDLEEFKTETLNEINGMKLQAQEEVAKMKADAEKEISEAKAKAEQEASNIKADALKTQDEADKAKADAEKLLADSKDKTKK